MDDLSSGDSRLRRHEANRTRHVSANPDAVLLVVSAGMDRRRDTVRSIELLKQINAPIVGTVLNRAPETDSYAHCHYGYGEKSPDKVEVKTGGKMHGTSMTATTNGNMGGNTSPVKVLPGEVEDAEWPSMGRHAKLGQSMTPGSPTLFPPQTGDGSQRVVDRSSP